MTTLKIAAIGECMVELSRLRGRQAAYRRSFGGDTLNTAVYLARLLPAARVHYVTRLGDDPLSDWMIAAWRAEGIDCSLTVQVAGRRPGLYMIDTDETGERSFSYWRAEAPARQLFEEDGDRLAAALKTFDVLYASGISLAILSDAGRSRLIGLMSECRSAGKIVAYDANYRARLWPDAKAAAKWTKRAVASSTHVLPSCDDLNEIFSATRAPRQWFAELAAMGASEIVLKSGGSPVLTQAGVIALEQVARPVDTTGAGDSFNAGYLASRLMGGGVEDSVRRAHALASRVVQYPGAIIAREAMADLIS